MLPILRWKSKFGPKEQKYAKSASGIEMVNHSNTQLNVQFSYAIWKLET